MTNSLYRFCFYIFALGFVITMGMGFITLIYYSARQNSDILHTCGRIFIASTIFLGLLIINISIPYLYVKCKNRKNITIQFRNNPEIINYQMTPENYFTINDDEEEIIFDRIKNKKGADNISIKSTESYLITEF